MACHSIFLRSFIDEIVRTRGRAPTEVERELVAVAQSAAVAHFGQTTPIEATLDELGGTQFAQRLEVVEVVRDARRQISRLDCERLGLDVAAGTIGLPIYYTAGGNPEIKNEQAIASIAPLPLHDEKLWDALNAALNEALQRYFPPRQYPEGTIGHVLQSRGAWTRGISGRSGDVEVSIESTSVVITSLSPTHEWADYGWELRVSLGDTAPLALHLTRGENEGNIRGWMELPSSDRARPNLETQLALLAQEIEAHVRTPPDPGLPLDWNTQLRFVNSYPWTQRLVEATLRPPAPGSLIEWMNEALPTALVGYTREVKDDAGAVRFRLVRVYPPRIGVEGFGRAAIRLAIDVVGGASPPVFDNPEYNGDVIQIGEVERSALDHPGPRTETERRDVDHVIGVFRQWLDAHLDHHVATRGLDAYAEMQPFYAFPGYFPLVELVQSRLELGPPGDPPIEPFDLEQLTRAAAIVKPVKRARVAASSRPRAAAAETKASLQAAGWTVEAPETANDDAGTTTIAEFTALGWTIILSDDCSRWPFMLPSIELVSPEGGVPVTVLMVDAWNPQARTVVDGDAFAFRRFVTWLREAIVRGGYDETVRFEGDHQEDDDEGEDEADGPIELSLSEWLLFDQPYFGDRFLVDWRAQWDIVNAIGKVEDFASIYGFTGAYLERLRTRDIPLWRRFLREVIDPRFDRTSGAKLVP
jgi:hypothetical protein